MRLNPSNNGNLDIINGEFFTDGKTFVFRLLGCPISGTGDTPEAAFRDLMRSESSAGNLSKRLRALARDQQGEKVRAAIVRASMAGLIVLAIVAGALVTGAAMMPNVAIDIKESIAGKSILSNNGITKSSDGLACSGPPN